MRRLATLLAGLFLVVLLVVPLALCAQTPSSAPRSLDLTEPGWKLSPEGARVTEIGGKPSLVLESGSAERPDVSFQDGIIELDVTTSARRSFVYVVFRIAGEAECEEFYLRPHKSNLSDASQYAPVIQGASQWQVFHGPGGTAPVALTPGALTHVKVAFAGRRAALFVNDMTKPVLFVPRLAHEPRSGGIAFKAFIPKGSAGSGPSAVVSSIVVRPGAVDPALSATVEDPKPVPGAIRSWMLSEALPEPVPAAVPALPSARAFQKVAAEPNGLVLLHRHVRLAENARRATAAARVHLRAAKAGLRRLDLGFSDSATVFLNGTPLAFLDDGYSFDAPRRDGVVGFDQGTVFLPLVAGDNELVVVVSDVFGGWALMGRFPDDSGLTVDAR
ncbi:MAG: hypothetical protein JNK60_12010 [Acidobacteria bacterium]|nr:hypothetical protein [Acidobacteriota bacterium]